MAVITFSQQMGAWGDEIAREVSDSLSYTYIDKENILAEAERFGLQRDELEKLAEKKPRLRDRIFSDRLSLYRNLLQSIILQFAKKGDTLIVGGGAYLILEGVPGCLRIKIIAPREERIRRMVEETGASREEATTLINQSDNNRAGFIKHIFDEDWRDAAKYDMVLNTGNIGRREAGRIIMSAATSESMRADSEKAFNLLQRLALARYIEALLITDKRIDARYVNVSVEEPGVVRLLGMVNGESEKQVAESISMSVEETTSVINELVVTVIPVTQTEPM
jgi:cytidylate kinase